MTQTADLWTQASGWIDRLSLPRLLILLALVSFVLRIFYSGYLFEDDGLWFTAAEQILRGKALYREVYFDKPPVLPLVYALLFRIFGAHIIVIRMFTMVLVTAMSAVIYLFGSSLYSRRIGILAAALFTFFSTTGVSGHVQGLNTDFLMALPYLAGAYLLAQSLRSRPEIGRSAGSSSVFAFAGGAATGIAMQTNPKGVFLLAFFTLLLSAQVFASRGHPKSIAAQRPFRHRAAMGLLALAIVGTFAGSLPVIAYMAATHSLADYVRDVWKWGVKYAGYLPFAQSFIIGTRVLFGYFALNSVLTIALLFFLVRMARRRLHQPDLRKTGVLEAAHGSGASTSIPASRIWEAAVSIQASDSPPAAVAAESLAATSQNRREEPAKGLTQAVQIESLEPDSILFIWLLCSFAAMAIGGRFYEHYIFEILPALCLVAARGLIYIKHWALKTPLPRWQRYARRAIMWVLAAGMLITLVRFHTRTAVLAIDWARGAKSASTSQWFYEILNREERMAAGLIGELPGGPEQAMMVAPEAMRTLHIQNEVSGPSDYLFVWGYRPEVYYFSGLIPASRFISIQPVTGIPADAQYVNGNAKSVLPEAAKQTALDQLLADLEATKPKYIVDEAGMFNSALDIHSYPGMAEFMRSYKQVGPTGRLMIYRRRDPSKKNRLSDPQ
jgi:hypothetical protein